MKIIVKILVGILCLVVLVGLALWGIAVVYKDEIIDQVLTEVSASQHLQIEKDKVALNMFSEFPYGRVEANEVRIVHKGSTPPLFEANAEQMQICLNWFKLLIDNQLEIQHILLKNGAARVHLPKQSGKSGQKNFWDNEQPWLKQVDKLVVQQFTVQIDDDAVGIEELTLSAAQDDSGRLLVQAKCKGAMQAGKIAQAYPLLRQPITVAARVSYHKGLLSVSAAAANVAGVQITGSGSGNNKTMAAVLQVKSKNVAPIAKFFMPDSLVIDKGAANADVELSGQWKKGAISLKASGYVKDVLLTNQQHNALVGEVLLEEAAVNLWTDNLRQASAYHCQITEANVSLPQLQAQGRVQVQNFDSPTIEADMQVAGELAWLSPQILQGEVKGNLYLKANGLSINNIEELRGDVEVQKMQVLQEQKTYHLNGQAALNKDMLSCSRLQVGTDFGTGIFNGNIKHYLNLWQANPMQGIEIEGQLATPEIQVDSLLAVLGDSGDDNPQFKVKLDIKADKLLFFNNLYKNTEVLLQYKYPYVEFARLSTSTFEGQLTGGVRIKIGDKSNTLSGDVYFSDIQIDKIHYLNQFLNTREGSLKGGATGRLVIYLPLTEGEADTKKMEATLQVAIQKGQMVAFEPLQKLSKYVKKDLLDNVLFSAIDNTINIANGAVDIPRMEIRSSALNVFLGGTHYFNGDYDYRITLFLSELLWSKAKDPENPIKDGKTKVFLRAQQHGKQFSVGYDREEWGKEFQQKLQREGNSFSEAKKQAEAPKGSSPVAIESAWDDAPAAATPATPPAKTATPETPPAPPKKEKQAVKIEWDD
ncbi:hypothetical protein FACS1894156_1850 [Bacteroidia bacterium]|nr:hypothetical protein FACS1894156_1850 [Bacteroidia bacterium]